MQWCWTVYHRVFLSEFGSAIASLYEYGPATASLYDGGGTFLRTPGPCPGIGWGDVCTPGGTGALGIISCGVHHAAPVGGKLVGLKAGCEYVTGCRGMSCSVVIRSSLDPSITGTVTLRLLRLHGMTALTLSVYLAWMNGQDLSLISIGSESWIVGVHSYVVLGATLPLSAKRSRVFFLYWIAVWSVLSSKWLKNSCLPV